MRQIVLSTALALTTAFTWAQEPKYDSAAIFILDRMSDVIGDLTSCHFTLQVSSDDIDPDKGLVRHYGVEEVYMSGPSKMLITVKNHKGHQQYFYNGRQLSYYSFTENNYGTIDAPPTTIETIDKVHDEYGINVPGADFFYPSLTDDLMVFFSEIRYVGKVMVDGKECFHILARNKDITAQFWINNDPFTLPARMLIVKQNEGYANHESTYLSWDLNPVLPEAMFEFLPPAGASRLRIVAKNQH